MKAIFVLLALVGFSSAAGIKSRTLDDDINDFINLLDLDEIRNVLSDHLESDGAFAAVVEYLQGPEWQSLVDTVLAKDQVQDLISFLEDAGLNVNEILDSIHNFIHDAKPGTAPDENGSLASLVDDVVAVLPINQLLDLLNKKLQNSPDFQALYLRISSDDGHNAVNEVLALPEAQRLIQRLTDLGLDVYTVLNVLYGFFGWDDAPKPPL